MVVTVPQAGLKSKGVPALEDDESYNLAVDGSAATLHATSVWGALRGLETFSQLLVTSDDASTNEAGGSVVCAASVSVTDAPRYKYRGLMIDTSRRYLDLSVILATLDAMAYAKMNVLHWHITDDQSFPLVIASFPKLSQKGSYNPGKATHIYTADDVQAILSAATERGIRVIPELDMPGHTHSWFKGYPELATSCPDLPPGAHFGIPMNPISPLVDRFVRTLWHEVNGIFPDRYVHIGGDEVNGDCWGANATIRAYMQKHFGNSSDFGALQAVFESKLLAGNTQDGKHSMVWQENFGDRSTAGYPPGTVVEVWKGNATVAAQTMRGVTMRGYDAVFTCKEWYFDYIPWARDYRIDDIVEWDAVYAAEPLVPQANASADALVHGGEACMWAPMQDSANFMTTTFPRALAVAERLWSPRDTRNTTDAAERVSSLRCRFLSRGLPIPPVNSGGWGAGGLDGDFCPTPARFNYRAPY